jgi:hypothetical protein
MAKIKVRKEVFDEVKDKLGASKNVFARGDFDEYKKFTELEKQTIPNGIYECLRYGYYLEPKGYEPQKCKTGVRNPRVSAHYELYKIQDGNYYQTFNDELEKSNPNHDSLGRFTYGKMLLAPDTGISGGSGFSYNSDVQHDGEFVLTKNGSKDFGEITPEMAKKMKRQAGKIRLRIGVENEKDKKNNYGEKHIDRDLRNKNLKDIGFDNARDFIEFITDDISYIFPNGIGLIAVREKNKHFSGAWIQLTPSKDGEFYDVKTASPLRSNWYKNKTPIWINPKLGVLTKSLGDPLAHQFNKIIESIYGISSNSNNIVTQQNNLSSKKVIKSLTYSGHKLQGRTRLYGMDISIENKKGSYRSGTDKDGHKWRTYMNYDYGYIRGTVGVDKDHLDCVSPDTKILMSDYTEKCASDIKIGDELIGIKIETQRYHQRKQIITKVLNVKKGVDDMLDITLSNGVKLRTTRGHLHYYFQGNTRDKYWKRADELKIGDKLVMIFNHKDLEESEDYKKGYLYGAYTGDGCYSFDESKQVYCDIRKGVDFIDVIHRVKKYWNDLGLETVDIKIEKPRQTNSLLADGRRIVSKMDLAILSIRGINKIRFIKSIFEKNPNSFEWCRGYIAGLFDTDGCLNCRHEFQITQTKNQDEFMKFTIECINKLGYQAVKRYDDIKLHTDYMADNVTMEFTQLIKPILEKKRNFLGQTYRYEPLEITDIKPYKGEFVAIQTDEQTYIANGLVTHNCYIGPDKEAQKVYVIHQNDPVTHKYDEDKCMLCFSSAADAKKAYMKQYDRPGFYGSMTTMTIDQFKSFIFSKKGKMIHKSFDIQITDITENNKQQKLEQFNKALNAIADKKPFMIKHIPADSSQRYENLTVRLMDFDRSKIEKAVHKVALSLDADISGASKGEAFVYKAQEEIVDKYFREFTNRTRAIYNFVISYFDLPDIRIVSKAGELRHNGKILYNPESGLPIKESDWKKFVVELEKYLNRNYTGIGEKIVLSSESLGIILDRLSKTNSLEAIRKMSLSQLKAKRYDVDWISESVKNMKDKFGEVISRERQARIQIAMDSAAQRVTRVKDDMRNNIQQIIIDGIRDKQSKSVVAQNLFDKCASLNRDMQRIADSEVQMASNSSYCKEEVYNSEPGSKVYFKRFEMIDDNTCKQCKKLNGTIVLWSDVPLPDEHIKDPYAKYAIWEGKNEGSCPIGIVHPYCRGTWVRYYPDLDKN